MKNLLIISCFFVLSSCLHVYFDRPQPKKGIILSSVPQEVQGRWADSMDIIQVTDNCLSMFESQTDSVGNIIGVDSTYYFLSDSINIQKAGNYYVVNLLERGQGWEVYIIDKHANGDVYWYYPKTAPYFGKGHGLRVDRIDQNYKQIEINDSTFKEKKPLYKKSLKPNKNVTSVNSVYYKGQFRIKDIDKIIIPENIFWVFKADGTIGQK